MKVTVVPQRPIPGILAKNKWISEKTELDLNRSEIIRCMSYGSVFYNDIQIVNADTLNKVFDLNKNITNSIKEAIPVVHNGTISIVEDNIKEEDIPNVTTTYSSSDEELVVDMSEKNIPTMYVSYDKEDDYILITSKVYFPYDKVEGNLYGLFTVSGSRPTSMEYLVDEEWVKFSNKFADFSELESGTLLKFRILPKNNSNIKYKISIKDKSNSKTILQLDDIIDMNDIENSL